MPEAPSINNEATQSYEGIYSPCSAKQEREKKKKPDYLLIIKIRKKNQRRYKAGNHKTHGK